MSEAGMIAATEQPVSEMDCQQLCRLVIEAVHRIDHGLADTYHEMFTHDGELIIPATTSNGKVIVPETTLRGRKAIQEWGQGIVRSGSLGTIRHVCGNMRFIADGPDAAVGRTVLTVYQGTGPGSPTTLPWSVGEDHDRFVRTEQGWRIASRRWVELFARPAVSNPGEGRSE